MIQEWINIKNEKEINNIGSFNYVKKLINDDLKSFLGSCGSKEKNIIDMVTIKSRSKKGLVHKIKALKELGVICSGFSEDNDKEEVEVKRKRGKSGVSNIVNEELYKEGDNEIYFKSEAHKIIFYLLEYDGKERMDKLEVYEAHYMDNELAKSWYTKLAKIVHPDKTNICGAEKAMAELASMYKKMVKNG